MSSHLKTKLINILKRDTEHICFSGLAFIELINEVIISFQMFSTLHTAHTAHYTLHTAHSTLHSNDTRRPTKEFPASWEDLTIFTKLMIRATLYYSKVWLVWSGFPTCISCTHFDQSRPTSLLTKKLDWLKNYLFSRAAFSPTL